MPPDVFAGAFFGAAFLEVDFFAAAILGVPLTFSGSCRDFAPVTFFAGAFLATVLLAAATGRLHPRICRETSPSQPRPTHVVLQSTTPNYSIRTHSSRRHSCDSGTAERNERVGEHPRAAHGEPNEVHSVSARRFIARGGRSGESEE